jgi:uncharacterized cupin superfamily protein
MRIVNQSKVPIEHRNSPKCTYEIFRQHISLAMGGIKDIGPWGGGHPFDIELAWIPPGKRNYPLHSHAAQTEYYIIVSGTGCLILDGEKSEGIGPGDHIILSPGEVHQLMNDSEQDLVYFVLADHHPADVTSYPHTGKRQLKPEYRCVRVSDADYYEGEE